MQEAIRDSDVIIAWKADREMITWASDLQLIQVYGAGVDKVDLKCASERRITVCNTAGAQANAISEFVFAAVLFWERKMVEIDRFVRGGNWSWKRRQSNKFRELKGRTLGIVGLGRTGQEIAKKALLFGLNVVAIKKRPWLRPEQLQLTFLGGPDDLADILSVSDYISINVPLTKDTYHMLGRTCFSQTKPNSVVINTSRGAVIDEKALTLALQRGRTAGAFLDVLEFEPPTPSNPLLSMPNVFFSGHTAGYTKEAIDRALDLIASNIMNLSKGQALDCVVDLNASY